jgi:NADH-quinone oxidoreductase subunit K
VQTMAETTFYLILGAVLFSLGTLGVLIRRNAIVVLMCIELMLNGANLTLVALAKYFGDNSGQVYVLFVLAIAAAEAAIGLAIVFAVFRNYVSVKVDEMHTLKG